MAAEERKDWTGHGTLFAIRLPRLCDWLMGDSQDGCPPEFSLTWGMEIGFGAT
jgi:hypothetical protein